MLPVDDVRASDGERERVVADLRTHAADGRLTVEELESRVDQALAATTRRDLAALTRDLPRARRSTSGSDDFGEHLRTYLSVMLLLVAIWALSGAGYPWFLWPACCWGFAVGLHAASAYGHRRRPRRRYV